MTLQAQVGPSSSGESPRLVRGARHPSGTAAGLASGAGVGGRSPDPLLNHSHGAGSCRNSPGRGWRWFQFHACVCCLAKGNPTWLSPVPWSHPVPNTHLLLFLLGPKPAVKEGEWLWASPNLQTVTHVPSGQIRETVIGVSSCTLKNVSVSRVVSSSCLISIASLCNAVDNKQSSTHFPLEIEEGKAGRM